MSGRRARNNRRLKSSIEGTRVNARLNHDPVGQSELTARPKLIQNVSYVIEPVFPEGHAMYGKSNQGKGSQGNYEVTYVLAIPGRGVTQTDVDFEKILEMGDSLLNAPKGVNNIKVTLESIDNPTEIVELTVGLNGFNRFSNIAATFAADSFTHAAQVMHDLVMPLLSRWSYQHDVPITTSALQIKELSTGSVRWDTILIPSPTNFGDLEGTSTADGRVLLAAFREGLSSLEPLYRALCMFRVIEGCYILRNHRQTEATNNGQPFTNPGEKLSLDQITTKNPRTRYLLEASFNPYLGWKFTKLRDTFRLNIRHAVAHLDPDGDPLAADHYDDIQKIVSALPVMHHMARTLLAAELNQEN